MTRRSDPPIGLGRTCVCMCDAVYWTGDGCPKGH